jgi:hypothetical protein
MRVVIPVLAHLLLSTLAIADPRTDVSEGSHADVAPRGTHSSVLSSYVTARSGIPSEIGAHLRAQANFSVRSSFFNAASALRASDLLAKACAPSTRTGGLERVNFAPLPLL